MPQTKVRKSPPSGRSSPALAPAGATGDFPIVGIGASAGGLEACRKLLDALPADSGMAFIYIQHLDPNHKSMLVDLLAAHTSMSVREATDGMPIEREHVYVIPPGTYLSVVNGALRLSQPKARHGARMPFDFLLHSLASDCGERAVGVILSGTGTDGSLGARSVKEHGGLVIAQSLVDAGYDGMPKSAILAGAVDLVLPAAKIPEELARFRLQRERPRARDGSPPQDAAKDRLSEIVDLLRAKTPHDFTLYKPGTLRRRIQQRMALKAIEANDMDRYLAVLRRDAEERDLLAKDLLINVTSFFRDPNVFDRLAERVAPELVRSRSLDDPLRIWIAGCSTGEETYSLAMLFFEQIAVAKRKVELQVFASDIDADAVAQAREGLYPTSIEAEVSSARLARFFTKNGDGYRVSPELRAAVVFTVQDVLTDPPFSRLDLISCRNLLIYLQPKAQAKVFSQFDFALRDGGFLLLGSAEAIASDESRFKLVSKSERLYRHVGHGQPQEFHNSSNKGDGVQVRARTAHGLAISRQGAFADLCRRLVLETYAPAAILINRDHECLFSLGPTDRYLRVAPGLSTLDLLAMARQGTRTRLRLAVQRAIKENARIVVPGGRIMHNGHSVAYSIAAQPVLGEGEPLVLVCFLDKPTSGRDREVPVPAGDLSRVAELEQDLEATRTELQDAIRDLDLSSQERKSTDEEALSVNEEYQSTNEELLASKEELQSLNEELTALNTQLQETLERQRTIHNDLQNMLYSTDVATLLLDAKLKIRLFTPATKLHFNVIASDIGRPLADLSALAVDSMLLVDALKVMKSLAPIECEIEARSGAWYLRRIMPYRTQDAGVEGVVITFTDVTERRRAAEAVDAAKRAAQAANVAKSRFLAAASHDLRQPLQTLALLQGLLAKAVQGERAQKLVGQLDETLSAVSGMLNTLLDINQIEAGNVRPELVSFPINDLLSRMRDQFAYHAQAQGLALRVVGCGLSIRSDPRLLEQMLRNLLSNALKYTRRGKVLLGCRRRKGMLSIEVWDTGIGIPQMELEVIFEEYHQLGNAARERSRGLGLGLSIVQRLGKLLDHKVSVRSQLEKGSVFTIDIPRHADEADSKPVQLRHETVAEKSTSDRPAGAILVVEDDPEVRALLELFLKDDGYEALSAPDGVAALELVANGAIRPDLLLADFNLPHGLDGLQLAAKLRERLRLQLPVIILTGDISTGTLRNIARQNCVQLNKPVKLKELTQAIASLLPRPQPTARSGLARPDATQPGAARPAVAANAPETALIYVVDDDDNVRGAIRSILEDTGRVVEDFASCEAFLAAYRPGRDACLLLDAKLPGMSGLEALRHLRAAGHLLPTIMITGFGDVSMAVQSMKAGALDFIEKPVGRGELLAGIERALEQSRDGSKRTAWRETAANLLAGLTARQRQIMDMVLAGHPSKNIAADLGVSQRTVENHRAAIMKRTGTKSLPALARLALAAVRDGGNDHPPAPPSPSRVKAAQRPASR